MTVTFTPNRGYAQISLDHPPGGDWINHRNNDALLNDQLFLDNQNALKLHGTSQVRLHLARTAAGPGTLRMTPFGGGADWSMNFADNTGSGSVTPAESLQFWKGGSEAFSILQHGIVYLTQVSSPGGVLPNKQGTYLAWNLTGLNGETNLVCHKGLGNGGFLFSNTANGTTFTTLAELSQNFGEGATSLKLLRTIGGVTSLVAVTQGAANSGGSGLRALVIPNA